MPSSLPVTPLSACGSFYFISIRVNIVLNLFDFKEEKKLTWYKQCKKKLHLHYANIIGAKKLLSRRYFVFLDVLCIQFDILLFPLYFFYYIVFASLSLSRILFILCILRAFEFKIPFSFNRILSPLLVTGNTVAPNVKCFSLLFSSRSMDWYVDVSIFILFI